MKGTHFRRKCHGLHDTTSDRPELSGTSEHDKLLLFPLIDVGFDLAPLDLCLDHDALSLGPTSPPIVSKVVRPLLAQRPR